MDKVQKIREEIERLMYGFNLEADIASCEDAETEKLADIKYQLCKKILDYIDEVQKEPVSEFPNTESMIESYKQRLISQANGVKNSPLIDMCLASYKHGINETLDTLNLSNLVRIGKREPKLKVGDRIKFKGIHNEDVTRVITDIKEGEGVGFWYFFADGSIHSIGDDGIELVEEPVSEDLEEAAKSYSNNLDNICGSIGKQTRNAFKAGAKWQKQQDQSTIELAEDHAMLAGMEKMKEKMLEGAIDAEVLENYDGKVIKYDDRILDEKLSDCKVFDKVKVILIKEN